MGDGSPLFHSSLDLLAHACEHYASDTERDRKFVILHLANATELLLKDRLLDLGISIYDSPKQTKSISRVLNDLERQSIQIPMKHIIELLIDERNNIQHRFGSPNSIMVKYYFDNSLMFFDEFMDAAFGLELREYLSNLLDGTILDYIYPKTESAKDILIQARLVARVHPSSSIVTAWMEIEKKVGELRTLLEDNYKKYETWFRYPASMFLRHLLEDYLRATKGKEKLRHDIIELSRVRNRVTHATTEVDANQAEQYIHQVESILPRLEELKPEILKYIESRKKSPTRRKKESIDS